MKKERFIISASILMVGGLITKMLGMIIKIVMTRIVGIEGIGIYTMIFPTFVLFMTLSQLGFPVAISKLVAEEKHNNKRILFSIIPFSLILNIILMLVVFIIAPYLSNNLLNDSRTYLPIIAIALVLPFDSMSAIFRGYFFGRGKMIPHVVSNVVEQVVRLILIIIVIPTLLDKNLIYAVTGLILVNIVSELLSALVLFLFMPKNVRLSKNDIRPSKDNIKSVLDVALPTTGGRLIGSIGYFLEPIILTSSLLFVGYNSNFVIREYGIIEGFVMPLLLLPSFFSAAISSALIPVVSKAHSDGDKAYIKRKLKQALRISFLIGLLITCILMINPSFFLRLIYNSDHGSIYLRCIAPFFLLYYIQSPLASILQAMGKAKDMMYDNLWGIIIRSILIFGLSLFGIGMFGFLIAMIVNIIIVTILHILHVKKELRI